VSAVGPIAIVLVSIWLLATIAYQFSAFQGVLGRLDVFRILPSWSFFAPSPANRDSHLVARDLLLDGTLTTWSPVAIFPRRSPVHLIWHPAKRPRKILRDASKTINRTWRRATSKGVIQCSLPYLVVLHYCMNQQPRPGNAAARQFAIIETSGREERRLWITFISGFHRF
jgi:hypothetical protein